MKNKILWILDLYSTKRDRSGNVYHGAVVTNCQTGRSFKASIDGISNLEHVGNALPGGPERYSRAHVHLSYHTEVPYPEYKRLFDGNYLTGDSSVVAETLVQLTGGFTLDDKPQGTPPELFIAATRVKFRPEGKA